jgi:hypothetical protein
METVPIDREKESPRHAGFANLPSPIVDLYQMPIGTNFSVRFLVSFTPLSPLYSSGSRRYSTHISSSQPSSLTPLTPLYGTALAGPML